MQQLSFLPADLECRGPFQHLRRVHGKKTLTATRQLMSLFPTLLLLSAGSASTPTPDTPLHRQVQCQAFGASEMLAVNVDGHYEPLSISEYIYHQFDGLALVKTVAPGAPIQPHWHYYANGTRQAGTFLGWNNFTTWAYLLDTQSQRYRIRLLTDDQQLYDGEFTGFVRVGFPGLSD